MILLFHHLPVSLEVKVNKFVDIVSNYYGSEFRNIQGDYWFGDKLTIKSLFPSWIIKEYDNNTDNVLVIPLFKNYLRWLFSLKYGYGAQLDWENIRCGISIDDKLLQGIAESYFPSADFSSDNLSDILPNIRRFSIQVQGSYFDIKGTNKAIKYVLTSLLDMPYSTTQVYTSAPGVVNIKANVLDKHKVFLSEHVIPAGMTVVYESV
jgi:hypothetical protein